MLHYIGGVVLVFSDSHQGTSESCSVARLVLLEDANGDSREGRVVPKPRSSNRYIAARNETLISHHLVEHSGPLPRTFYYVHRSKWFYKFVIWFESDLDGKYFIYPISQTANDDQPIYKWAITSSGQISRGEWNSSGCGGAWLEDVELISPCNGTFADDGCGRRAWPNCSHPNGNDFSKDKVKINFNMFDILTQAWLSGIA
ncbi:hypothetical protein MRB53_020866 [Persea americana]|uniref:Uncharacterized protein n=1 Tax=Persea americana TaxID=3435 RepID=A0ACC2L271_PERAE|nr:hypothetical protein MRB53_020866 [Persea americana]